MLLNLADDCMTEDTMGRPGSWYLLTGGCYSTSSDTKDKQDYIEGWQMDRDVNATWKYEPDDILDG